MAQQRRRNGEGSVYQATDGRWVARISLGTDPETGKPLRKVAYGHTPVEARKKLKMLLVQQYSGELSTAVGKVPTVKAWLDAWLARREASLDFTERTNVRTRELCERHILPALGHVQLSKLTAAQVKGMTDAMQRKGLNPGTAFNTRAVLRTALNDAARERLIVRNVAADAKPPKRLLKEMRTLSAEEAQRLIEAAPDAPEGLLYAFLVSTGLRLGEALGLTWDCFDWETNTLHVRKQLQRSRGNGLKHEELKTMRSQRVLVLNQAARAALFRQRNRQQEARLRRGREWQGRLDLIFTMETGRPMDSVAHHPYFRDFLHAHDLPVVRIHDLRHTYASLALAANVDPVRVSRALGHSNVMTTLNTYAHVIQGGMEALAKTMDEIFKDASRIDGLDDEQEE